MGKKDGIGVLGGSMGNPGGYQGIGVTVEPTEAGNWRVSAPEMLFSPKRGTPVCFYGETAVEALQRLSDFLKEREIGITVIRAFLTFDRTVTRLW